MEAAGLIFDSSFHYLDHLAPLCALMEWPLILCDPDLQELAAKYYPDLKILDAELPGLGQSLNDSFTHIVTCEAKPLLIASLGPFSFTPIWLPHGNSDKGRIGPYFEALREEKVALIYGQKMADFLSDKKVQIPTVIRIGDFRRHYYNKMRSFYDALPLGITFAKQQFTILYAPTWEDSEKNCSFWQDFPILAKNLPSSINLLVKLHPNTIAQHAPKIERLIGQTENANLQFLPNFPPILPLLARSDAYLSDRSSIGYDFLGFDKPLYFLDPHTHLKGRDLLRCGARVKAETFYNRLSDTNYSKERQEMNAYTFEKISLESLKERLHALGRPAFRG